MKDLTCRDILVLEQILPNGRKEVKKRLVNLNLSRDLLNIRKEAEAIRDALENLRPKELTMLEEQFRDAFRKREKEVREKGKHTPPEIIEMEVRANFENYDKMNEMRGKYIKEEKLYLKEPSSLQLITKIKESDLPENCGPETTDALIYFME